MSDLIILDFLWYLGLPNAYGQLVSEYSSFPFSNVIVRKKWLESQVGVIVVNRLSIVYRGGMCDGGIFSAFDWRVELGGVGLEDARGFLYSLGGGFLVDGVSVSLAVFKRLWSVGCLSLVGLQGNLLLECFFEKVDWLVGYRREARYRYICDGFMVGSGVFLVLSEDNRFSDSGDYWVEERKFARLLLDLSVVRGIHSYLFD